MNWAPDLGLAQKKARINEPSHDNATSEPENYKIVSASGDRTLEQAELRHQLSKSQLSTAKAPTEAAKREHQMELVRVQTDASRSFSDLKHAKHVIDEAEAVNQHIILNTIYEQRETVRQTTSSSPFNAHQSWQSTQRMQGSQQSTLHEVLPNKDTMPSKVNITYKDGPLSRDGSQLNREHLTPEQLAQLEYMEDLMSLSKVHYYKEFMEELRQTNKQIK